MTFHWVVGYKIGVSALPIEEKKYQKKRVMIKYLILINFDFKMPQDVILLILNSKFVFSKFWLTLMSFILIKQKKWTSKSLNSKLPVPVLLLLIVSTSVIIFFTYQKRGKKNCLSLVLVFHVFTWLHQTSTDNIKAFYGRKIGAAY